MDASFNTVTWANESIIYEVNIRQFTPEGTFKAFQKHLPRLKDMGVTLLWFMPITPISEKLKKGTLGSYYACSSYTKINPAYGNESDLLELVNSAHDLGMKVIIDWVANHTGAKHEWMDKNPEWFSRDAQGNFTERNGWEDVVDLNYENQPMRDALIASMQYWVRHFNIDGFRCDMAHLVPLDFWKSARAACDNIKTLFWLAECEEVGYHQVFDISYAWAWMHAIEKTRQDLSSLNDVYNILHAYDQYPAGALKLFFTSNHDENSWNGTEYEKFGVAAKAWAVFTYTWKGIPLIYSGQEMPNHKRLQFFDKDCIEWNEKPALHDFYKTLATCRQQYPAILHGANYILPTDSNGVMAYLRYDSTNVVLVLLNISTDIQKIACKHDLIIGTFTNIFSGLQFSFNNEEAFELMPGDYLVYVK